MRTCTLCDAKHYARGLCFRHYDRAHKAGQLPKPEHYLNRMSAAERLALHSSEPTVAGCILWTGAKNSETGYGRMRFQGRRQLAHRVAYVLANGPIDDAVQVLHQCDNPYCINPLHLFLGTHADNMADKVSKGRQSRHQGVAHPSVKLSEEQVLAIRADPRIHRRIGESYGLSRSTVSYIKTKKLWPHL